MLPSGGIYNRSNDTFSRPSFEGIAELPFTEEGEDWPKIVHGRLVSTRFSSFRKQENYRSGRSSSLVSRSSFITGRSHPWDVNDESEHEHSEDSAWDIDSSNTYDGSIESLSRSNRKMLQNGKTSNTYDGSIESLSRSNRKMLQYGKTFSFRTTTHTAKSSLPTMEIDKHQKPPLHPPSPTRTMRKPLCIEANIAPKHALSTSPRLSRRPFVMTAPRNSLLASDSSPSKHQHHASADEPTPKRTNTTKSYNNRFLPGKEDYDEKKKKKKKKKKKTNPVTGIPTSTYEVDAPSTPKRAVEKPSIRLGAQLQRQGLWPRGDGEFTPSAESESDSRNASPNRPSGKLRAEASKDRSLERVREEAQLSGSTSKVKETLTNLEPFLNDSKRQIHRLYKSSKRKHKKTSRRVPSTPSTQNTSPSSIASQFSENMIQVAGESAMQVRMSSTHHVPSMTLTDMFSWGQPGSTLSHMSPSPNKLTKKKKTNCESLTPSSTSHQHRNLSTPDRARPAPMWQGDDEKSLVSSRSRPAPMWQDDDTIVSGTSAQRSRPAPIWQEDSDTSSFFSQRSRPAPMRQGDGGDASLTSVRSRPAPIWQGDGDASFPPQSPQRNVVSQPYDKVYVSPPLRSVPAPFMQEDARISTSGTTRSRPAPMWREEARSTRLFHIASPRPEKDYRQFFQELAASYNDDFVIVEDAFQEDLVIAEEKLPKENYRQFFDDLSDSNELVFQDARTYADNWKCDSSSPASVESSISDDSVQDAIQFSESLEESLKSESACNSKGGSSAVKRFVQRLTGRTVSKSPV